MHANPTARYPRLWLLVKAGVQLALAAACVGLLTSGLVPEAVQVMFGGAPGKIHVTFCQGTGRSTECFGTFTADTGFVIDDAVVETKRLAVSTTVSGVVGGPYSRQVYPPGHVAPLAAIGLFVMAATLLVVAFAAFTLRPLIDRYDPDIWPPLAYWGRVTAVVLVPVSFVAMLTGIFALALW